MLRCCAMFLYTSKYTVACESIHPPWQTPLFPILLPYNVEIKNIFRGFDHLIYTTCLSLWRCNILFIVKQTRNESKKTENLSVHNYSPQRSQYFVEPTFCSNYSCKSLGKSLSLVHLATVIFAHSSRQNCSSSFKLDGFRSCTAIFKSYHRFSIGLRSGLWLGHSKTFKGFPLNHSSVALAVWFGHCPAGRWTSVPVSNLWMTETDFPQKCPCI